MRRFRSDPMSVALCSPGVPEGELKPHSGRRLLGLSFLALTQVLEERLPVNRLDSTALEVVVKAVEHVARLRKLRNVSGHGVLKQLVGRTSGFYDQLVNLGLQLGGEVYFHAPSLKGGKAACQFRPYAVCASQSMK